MVSLLLPVIYLTFISLGLPDAVLGAAWPSIYPEFGVPVSYAGIISLTISAMTVVSSLNSDRLTRRFGPSWVTVVSVAMTATALFGFSISHSMVALILWAIPYGLGAGSIDAALNNYVALHYASRHMSWLHCMWGVGATLGPYILGLALNGGRPWNMGYRWISFIQIGITLILLLSLPLWKKMDAQNAEDSGAEEHRKAMTLKQIIRVPGAKEIMFAFFCYAAVVATGFLWTASYLTLNRGVSAELAATMSSILFIGMTVGRALNGFLTIKFSDRQLIFFGAAVVAVGLIVLVLPIHSTHLALAGILLLGLGCAPIYPCIIHSTPAHFGADKSQAIVGVQMASAYSGTTLMPPLFGLIANHISISLFPYYIGLVLILMTVMYARLERVTADQQARYHGVD